jgi:hypothetical protein
MEDFMSPNAANTLKSIYIGNLQGLLFATCILLAWFWLVVFGLFKRK